jgi:renalase
VAQTRTIVVGAGIAGLLAARRLQEAGHEVVVLDKGRGVGGRLATRRVGGARLDHGAQFFTVRSDAFAGLVDHWRDGGVAREWCRGFAGEPDGHPRYVGRRGMTDLAKDLAPGLDVRTGVTVTAVRRDGAGWSVCSGAGEMAAGAVIMTAPVPQTRQLLAAGSVVPDREAGDALADVRYAPCFALLAVLEQRSAVPEPGGVQLEDGPFSWVGDNQAKGISEVPAVTLHASGDWTAPRLEDDPAQVRDGLLREGRRWLGAEPVEVQLVRWRHSRPVTLHDGRCLVAVDGGAPIVCAGDAFGEPKVEGAARSGWAAADAVLTRTG